MTQKPPQHVMKCQSLTVRSLVQPYANVLRLVLDAHSCASALNSVIENDNKHLTTCAFADRIILYSTIVLRGKDVDCSFFPYINV